MNLLKKKSEITKSVVVDDYTNAQEASVKSKPHADMNFVAKGLCSTCDCISFCIWKENGKLNCEHFE